MKLPSFDDARRLARVALNAGRPVPALTMDILGLYVWFSMPANQRATAIGRRRRGMVREYVRAIRARLPEATAAAVIQGVAR